MNIQTKLPVVDLYGVEELKLMALHMALTKQGVEDPAVFLQENVVKYVAAFKSNVGVAITITEISTKATRSSEPT